ncbi:MAG: hypothetical protein V1802_02380 [Candidatus Aenigmatarchaeota archaeon]
MVEIIQKVLVSIITVLIVLVIATVLFAEGFNQPIKDPKAIGVVEKFSGIVKLVGTPSANMKASRFVSDYSYEINLSAGFKSSQDTEATVSMLFKGTKVHNPDIINLKKNDAAFYLGKFTLRSKEAPLTTNRRIGTQRSALYQGKLSEGEGIVLDSFAVMRLKQLNNLEFIEKDIVECLAVMTIECKDDKAVKYIESWFRLKDKSIDCDKQGEDMSKCEKSFDLCKGEVKITLEGFTYPEKGCEVREPKFIIELIEMGGEWKDAGDEMLISLWKKPAEGVNDCWERDMVDFDKRCYDMLLGIYSFRVLPEQVTCDNCPV